MEILAFFIGQAVMFGIIATLMATRRRRAISLAGRKHLTYPLPLRGFGIVGLAFLLFLSSTVISETQGQERLIACCFLIPFSALLVLGVSQILFTRISFDSTGIGITGVLSQSRRMSFEEMVHVDYSYMKERFVIEDEIGQKITLSKRLHGAEELARAAAVCANSYTHAVGELLDLKLTHICSDHHITQEKWLQTVEQIEWLQMGDIAYDEENSPIIFQSLAYWIQDGLPKGYLIFDRGGHISSMGMPADVSRELIKLMTAD